MTTSVFNFALANDTVDNSGSAPRAALSAVPWLAAVSGATLDLLAEAAVLHRVPPGSLMFEQGVMPAFAVLLTSGSVDLMGVRGSEETPVEFVQAIDFLLLAAVLNRQPYLLRARVLDAAELVMIPAEVFRRAVGSDHALCLAVLACQAAQFRRQAKQTKSLKLRSVEERAGAYLLGLVDRTPEGQAVQLPLEKRLIAAHLGMTRETFSRTLAVMPRYGIRVTGGQVIVEDAGLARGRFPYDALIDGPEPVAPLPLESRPARRR